MNILQSFIIAVSMYSKIPVPAVEWKQENMRYALCFFPVVGLIIGGFLYLAGTLMFRISVGSLFRAAVFTLVPVLISGGIHMDGFMDTMDALGSCGDQERKLEILKDSHAGAFAILGLGCYLVWSMAVWSEMNAEKLSVCCMVYVLSRALSGLSAVTFPAAKSSSLLKAFQDKAEKRTVSLVMVGYLTAILCASFAAAWREAAGMFLGAGMVYFYYRRLCRKQFGGVTGDLAGYFLELSELAMLTGILVCGGVGWN